MNASHDPLASITVADDAGATATIEINPHVKLDQLLRRGLKALYGEPGPNAGDYDLVIGGTIQEDLDRTIADVGLADGSEVAILRKDLPRG